MTIFKLLCRSARAALVVFLAFSGREGFAREARPLVHKMPPLSQERLDDIIHEFPPLRPVPPPRFRAPEPPPRQAYDAPTLAEAPRRPYDGPTLDELGVPPPAPPAPPADAGEKFAETLAHMSDVVLLPEVEPSALTETYARTHEGAPPSGEALKAAIALLRSKADLVHFLWPKEPSAPIPDAAAAGPPPAPAAPDGEESTGSNALYLAALGVLLAALLFSVLAKRKGLRDELLARVAKLRERKQEDDASTPPVDLSRLERLARRATSGNAASAPEPRRETAAESALPVSAPSASAPQDDAAAGVTDDLVLVEPGDVAATSAAINAALKRREGDS